jgi:hypothetical protein
MSDYFNLHWEYENNSDLVLCNICREPVFIVSGATIYNRIKKCENQECKTDVIHKFCKECAKKENKCQKCGRSINVYYIDFALYPCLYIS